MFSRGKLKLLIIAAIFVMVIVLGAQFGNTVAQYTYTTALSQSHLVENSSTTSAVVDLATRTPVDSYVKIVELRPEGQSVLVKVYNERSTVSATLGVVVNDVLFDTVYVANYRVSLVPGLNEFALRVVEPPSGVGYVEVVVITEDLTLSSLASPIPGEVKRVAFTVYGYVNRSFSVEVPPGFNAYVYLHDPFGVLDVWTDGSYVGGGVWLLGPGSHVVVVNGSSWVRYDAALYVQYVERKPMFVIYPGNLSLVLSPPFRPYVNLTFVLYEIGGVGGTVHIAASNITAVYPASVYLPPLTKTQVNTALLLDARVCERGAIRGSLTFNSTVVPITLYVNATGSLTQLLTGLRSYLASLNATAFKSKECRDSLFVLINQTIHRLSQYDYVAAYEVAKNLMIHIDICLVDERARQLALYVVGQVVTSLEALRQVCRNTK